MTDLAGLTHADEAAWGEALSGAVVLQIVPALDGSPAGRDAIDVAAALAEAGARALVASEGGRFVGELQARGGLWLPFPVSSGNPLTAWRNGERLGKLVHEEKVEVVHARTMTGAWAAHFASKRTGSPMVLTFDAVARAEGTLARRVAGVTPRADAIIAGSRAAAELIALTWPNAAGRVRIVPHGIDLDAFSPFAVSFERVEALRRGWDLTPGERLVLMPPPLTEGSGHDVFIEAAAMLRNAGIDDAVFLICDDGRHAAISAGVDRTIAAAGLEGVVRRVAANADRPAALAAASVVAMPSSWSQPSGAGAAEAQAMGCPVVAPDDSGAAEVMLAPPEVSERARTGWRVPIGEPGALAEALSDALALGASARDSLSSRARAAVEARHSVRSMCRGTLAVYGELVASGR